MAIHQMRTATADTVLASRHTRGLNQGGVRRQPEIVIGRKVEQIEPLRSATAGSDELDVYALSRGKCQALSIAASLLTMGEQAGQVREACR